MKKDIKDYLPLYYHQRGIVDWVSTEGQAHFAKVGANILIDAVTIMIVSEGHLRVKPLLRPLDDMTEEERGEVCCAEGLPPFDDNVTAALRTKYLLSKHFDLFGLIEAGLAIDKTKKH